MAEIGQRTFVTDGTKQFLRLYNEEFVRPLNVPAQTTTMRFRIGLLVSLANSGGNFAVKCFVGLCAGANSSFTSASTVHALGWYWDTTFSYNAGAGNPYYTSGGGFFGMKRVNGVNNTTNSGSFNGFFAPTNTGAVARRSILLIDIFPWNSITAQATATAQSATDLTPNDLVQVMENKNINYGPALSLASASNQNPGGVSTVPLDCLNIYWNNGLVPLEIYAICVYTFFYI